MYVDVESYPMCLPCVFVSCLYQCFLGSSPWMTLFITLAISRGFKFCRYVHDCETNELIYSVAIHGNIFL